MILEISFRGDQPLDAVRRFLAEVVRTFRPDITGDWVETKRESRPHSWLPLLPDMARVDLQLGDATLVQVVAGDEHGNPRDGFGYNVEFDLRFPAANGTPRRLFHLAWSWDPFPNNLTWRLEGFSFADFMRLRALGRAHFSSETTADAWRTVTNANLLIAARLYDEAKALLTEAFARKQDNQGPSVLAEFAALRRRFGIGELHLSFRTASPLEPVRAFLAEVVRLTHPEAAGEWTVARTTPKPHPHLSGPELAETDHTLGPARLRQSVTGDTSGGNPRDGWGYDLALELTFGTRQVTLSNSSWDPAPSELHFKLEGLTAEEFLRARALGQRRFGADDTANPVWAAANVATLAAIGATAEARQLLEEALRTPAPDYARTSVQQLERLRAEIAEDGQSHGPPESLAAAKL